jgi:hypothetical protein
VDSGSPGVEYNIGGSVVTTNQDKIWSQASVGRSQSSSTISSQTAQYPLASVINGTSLIYVVHAVQVTNEAVGIGVNWIELR